MHSLTSAKKQVKHVSFDAHKKKKLYFCIPVSYTAFSDIGSKVLNTQLKFIGYKVNKGHISYGGTVEFVFHGRVCKTTLTKQRDKQSSPFQQPMSYY